MPELPEVETVKRGLERLIVGKTITTAHHDTPKSFPNSQADVDQFLIGARIDTIQRRAKVLLINLSTEYTLVIHLKMTGQLVFVGKNKPVESRELKVKSEEAPFPISSSSLSEEAQVSEPNGQPLVPARETRFGAGHPNASLVGSLPDRSTRVTFTFDDGAHLFFNDQRKFGWVRLLPTVEVPNINFMQRVGPEPLSDAFNSEDFIKRFARRKKSSIKAALLDQTVIAGIGNIYADESLFAAKIHPSTQVQDISEEQFKNLYITVRNVLNLSIEKGGSTDKNYVDAEGNKGSYLTFANVFRREGKPCPVCGTEIMKLRVAGRGTHVCPRCQIKPK